MVDTFNYGLGDKAVHDPADLSTEELLAPASKIVPLPTDGTLFAPTKMVLADAAGTATVIDTAGNTVTSFRLTGQEQHIAIKSLASVTGATHVFGLY